MVNVLTRTAVFSYYRQIKYVYRVSSSYFTFHVILQSVQALRTMFCFCPPFSVAGNEEGKTEQKGVAITHEILLGHWNSPF